MKDDFVQINTVLISVTDKTGLEQLVQGLKAINPSLTIIASGGTAQALEAYSQPYIPLHDYTGFSECFGGRVKTLHPKVMGGILYRRGRDEEEALRLGIQGIDLVICNLYNFEKASQNNEIPLNELIEHIDIGGSTLIRSSCKNFSHVGIVVDPNDYSLVLEDVVNHQGKLSLESRQYLAFKALNLSASYEALLAKEMAARLRSEAIQHLHLAKGKSLRYGENPDQKAWVYEMPQAHSGIAQCNVLGGKELSHNNYEDATVAYDAAQALHSLQTACGTAIVKHGSLCGYSTGPTLTLSFERAWEGDPKSAFGSVIAMIHPVTSELIPLIKSKFIEVLIAPSFDDAFIQWASTSKPNMRLLEIGNKAGNPISYKSISGGILVQTKKENPIPHTVDRWMQPCDPHSSKKIGVVTRRQPLPEQRHLFGFGIAAVNFAKSNAVAIVRDYSSAGCQLLSLGAGQPNRVDALLRLALPKAIENLQREQGHQPTYLPKSDLEKCILASDGFFPFDDSILAAAKEGIKYCIQPGGSTNDESVIAAADAHDMCMIFTGERYFFH